MKVLKVFLKLLNKRLGRGCAVIFSVCLLLSSIIMTSCENFMQGSAVIEQLEKEINYAGAPSFTVRVVAKDGTGSIIVGGGDNTLKVTDHLTVSFQKNVGYRFIEWQAVNKNDNSVLMSDYVKFEPTDKLETVVTLLKESDEILIQPLCEASQAIIKAFPVDSDKGVCRDSSIELDLTYPLSESNDLSKIKVAISDSNVNGMLHFQSPELVENKLIILPDMTNRISVTDGELKTLTVTIPSDFKYQGDNGEFEIGEELKHSYKINSSTSDKTFITYGSEDADAGNMKVNGLAAPAISQQYNIGESITVTYKINDGYIFEGWDYEDSGVILVTHPEDGLCDEKGFNSTTQTATAIIRILNQNKNFTFKAVTKAIPTLSLQIGPADKSGILKVNGVSATGEEKIYRQGDVISVSFTLDDAYRFEGWSTNDTEGKYIKITDSDSKETDGFDSKTGVATIKVEILDGNDSVVTLKPIAPEISKEYIQANSQYGRFNISVQGSYKEGEGQLLGFTSDPDYQFIRWRIVDTKKNKEISNWTEKDGGYIFIEDLENPTTSFTLKKAPNKTNGVSDISLKIEPVCIKRPKVVSVSPLYDTEGVYRDRKITIMFDQKLSAESIYYSESEKSEIEKDNENSKVNWLGDSGKQYGYYLDDNKDTKTYKCVSIVKLNNPEVNLLKHYGEPAFDNGNTGVLRIPALPKEDPDYNKIGIPPSVTDILVSVTTDFGVNVISAGKTNTVTLSGEYSWSYYTNSKYDNDAPKIDGIEVHFANGTTVENVTTYSKGTRPLSASEFQVQNEETEAKYRTVFPAINTESSAKGLWISGSISDSGSGPKALSAKVYKLDLRAFYPYAGDKNEVFASIEPALKISGPTGTVSTLKNETYDENGAYLDLKDLSEGYYKVVLTATDKNDLESNPASFYFIYDVTGPDMSGVVIKENRTGKLNVDFSWTNPNIQDLFEYKMATVDVTEEDKLPTGESLDTEDLPTVTVKNKCFYTGQGNQVGYDPLTGATKIVKMKNQHKYKHTFTFYDWAGNPSAPIEVVDNEGPKSSTITYGKGTKAESTSARDKIYVKYIKSDDQELSYSKYSLERDASDRAVTGISGAGCLVDFKGSNRRFHTITIKDYDYSGNVTISYVTLEAVPKIGMIYYADGYWSTEYDAGHKPEGVICKVDSDSEFYIWDIWDQYGYCWGVPGLKIQTEYDSGIVIYDKLTKQFGETIMRQNGFSRKQTSNASEYSPSMWTYIIDKNKEAIPTDVSSEKWFIPSVNEMYYVFNNLETLETSFNKISAGYGHTDREKINNFAYRQVQLIQSSHFSFYWTCTLHNTYRYHCCPVAFNCDKDELYLSIYGLSDWGNTWHSYKGTAFRMGVAKINNNSYSDNYIMDRCNRNCNDKYDTIDGEWGGWDMKTHAMALVTLSE